MTEAIRKQYPVSEYPGRLGEITREARDLRVAFFGTPDADVTKMIVDNPDDSLPGNLRAYIAGVRRLYGLPSKSAAIEPASPPDKAL